MGFFAVFVYGFECMKAGLNAGKRGIVFQTRENTRGAGKYTRRAKNARFARTCRYWT